MRYKAPDIFVGLFLLMICSSVTGRAQDTQCRDWHARVDPTIKSAKTKEQTGDKHLIQAIACLLKLEGRKDDSKLRGATRLDVSQTFGPASVQVAALYYISFLYTQKWDHGSAVALRDAEGEVDTEVAVAQAFHSYKIWFERVKTVGVAKAREMNLQPLVDTKVRWY